MRNDCARRWAAALAAIAVVLHSGACGPDQEQSTQQLETQWQRLEAGEMPDLVGYDLNHIGDETGLLYELWDEIGIQTTLNIGHDSAREGSVFDQSPPAGTQLSEVDGWTLSISGGGPTMSFDELPRDVAEFAASLPGFDDGEPIIDRGNVYKTDRWLFGLNCQAVDAHYRTFSDARYDLACPGNVQVAPQD